ncbi:MAG: NINE protein [Oscillospiraceae bacterium]|nr:NINE protein [Oscillospiraceae bacterium]
MYCHNCGTKTDGNFCPNCGTAIKTDCSQNDGILNNASYEVYSEKSDRDWLVTLLFCIFLGFLGIHRFYAGKIGTGVLYLLTGGLFGIGIIVDLIVIACGNFRDIDGRIIRSFL